MAQPSIKRDENKRLDGRLFNQLRSIHITYNVFDFAAGSTLYEIGKTKVLCAVTLQAGVPPFLRGKKSGWLNAEYAMLPTATPTRNSREIVAGKRSGRTVEISRMIGRVLRSVVNLDVLGERTIMIDCDVQQADGGTRTASITGAFLALKAASDRWLQDKIIEAPLLKEDLAAISVGVVDGQPMLDVSFIEDSEGEADFNFVVTRSGALIEIQGSAEKNPLAWNQFEQVRTLAYQGINTILTREEFFNEHKGFSLAARMKNSESI